MRLARSLPFFYERCSTGSDGRELRRSPSIWVLLDPKVNTDNAILIEDLDLFKLCATVGVQVLGFKTRISSSMMGRTAAEGLSPSTKSGDAPRRNDQAVSRCWHSRGGSPLFEIARQVRADERDAG